MILIHFFAIILYLYYILYIYINILYTQIYKKIAKDIDIIHIYIILIYMNKDIENANIAGNRLRRYVLAKNKNSNIDNILSDEINSLLKAVNKHDYNLLIQTLTPIYIKYQMNMPNVFYKVLEDDEHFEKIITAFILGLKGSNKPASKNSIIIDNEECYDINTVAEMLGVVKLTVQKWIKSGKLKKANSPQFKKTYIKKSDVENFISNKN